jgi:4-amino-4-deoxy-L-arabinose transferase-like glycosyltransferase
VSRSALLLFLTAALMATVLASPGFRDLQAGDESGYARIVAEMESSGDLAVLRLGGEPYTDKPPLHFWAVLALTRLLGAHSTWPYVLPSIVSYFLLVGLIGWLGSRWIGPREGRWAAFFAATSLLLWGSAQTARMDAGFALAITAAVALIHEGMTTRRARLLILGGFAASLATMIKGPAPIAIALLVWAVEAIRLRRSGGRAAWIALAASAALPLLWIEWIAVREGEWVAFDLLFTQNLGRSIESFAHPKPFWYFLARFPSLFFPWFAILAIALVHALSRGRRRAIGGFLAGWFLAILALFSLVSGKLDVYILPAVAPASLLCALWLREGSARGKRGGLAANATICALLALAALVTAVIPERVFTDSPEGRMAREYPVVVLALAIGGIWLAALAAHLVRGPVALERSVLAVGIAVYATIVIALPFFLPFYNRIYSSRPLIDALRNLGVEGETLVHYQAFYPWGRDFDFDDPKIVAADPWSLKRPNGKPLPRVVVTRDSRATELGKPLREDYRKAETVRIRRKNYEVFVRE